jgi:Sensors of blue-light using FAD
MLQLVYISTARQPIDMPMCTDILHRSRINNGVDQLSGLLVAGSKRFLQVLEGPAAEVRQTYDRIAADPRHYACVVLSEREIEARQFGDWAMGFTPGGSEANDDSSLSEIVAALVAPVSDPNLRAQFTGFAELQARAA